MISAILYATNTGYTKEYATMLSEKTGLPAYNIKNSLPPDLAGAEVLFMGWLMAGNVQGYKKICSKYAVKAICAVGMSPKEPDQTEGIKKAYALTDTPVFYLMGGFDMKKLKGIYKFMMGVMSKKIIGDMSKLESRTPEQEQLYTMATEGASCVSEENLLASGVLDWYEGQK